MLTATDLLAAMDQHRFAAPAGRERLEDMAAARRIQSEINRLRLERGDKPLGYKIGFTNRSLWPLYGVFDPIWAPVWDKTVVQSDAGPSVQIPRMHLDQLGKGVSSFSLPRLEPEIVVGLRKTPASDSIEDVADAVDWVAHGYEVVQSAWPEWKFTAPEAFAAQGMHGALLIGPRREVRVHGQLAEFLRAVRINLTCNGDVIADGDGTAVLDGPIEALGHLVRMLQAEPPEPPFRLGAGSIITTGTLTDAQPLLKGQHWATGVSSSASAAVATGTLAAPLVDLSLHT
jgi:2-oxo-3-hexenedioate decarboxylase